MNLGQIFGMREVGCLEPGAKPVGNIPEPPCIRPTVSIKPTSPKHLILARLARGEMSLKLLQERVLPTHGRRLVLAHLRELEEFRLITLTGGRRDGLVASITHDGMQRL